MNNQRRTALAKPKPVPAHVKFERAHELLRYDPETGRLHYRDDAQDMRGHRHRQAGKEAFLTRKDNGYLVGKIDGRRYYAGPIIMLLTTGTWPEGQVDHINHIRDDNRLKNLRDISRSENMRNNARSIANTSGTTGVVWARARGKWVARINVNGKRIHIGCFTKKLDAISARRDAQRKYGFSTTHGQNEYKAKANHQPFGPKERKGLQIMRIKDVVANLADHNVKYGKQLRAGHPMRSKLVELLANGLCGRA